LDVTQAADHDTRGRMRVLGGALASVAAAL